MLEYRKRPNRFTFVAASSRRYVASSTSTQGSVRRRPSTKACSRRVSSLGVFRRPA